MTEGEIILYQSEDGQTKVEVRVEGESVWLTLNQLAELFQRDKSVISRHIKNVFEEGELRPESVVAKNATTAADGKTYLVDYYNLDMIISVGYRVNSHRGTQFRIWATQRLREYIIKGYMKDWIKRLNDILTINEREVLEHAGRISKALADELAGKEYDKFKARQQALEQAESLKELEADLKKLGSGKEKTPD